MKKIVMMLLLLVSTNVFATDWVKAGENDKFTNYVDSQSIRRDGNKVRAWTLDDYKSGQVLADNKTRYLSTVARQEFDCFEDTVRTFDRHGYSEKMGTGDIVISSQNLTEPAVSLPPGSMGATVFKAVCAVTK
jgi:hypothetical protein